MADIDDLISKEALKSISDLEATFARIITTVDKLIAESKSLDVLLSAMNKMSTAQENLKNVSKKALDINKQLRDSEDDIVKGKIRFANVNKEQRNTLSALVTLEDQQAGTLEKLAARNKLLREEQRKLNLETETGIKRNKEINAELNKNTKFIKDNSDNLVKNKMNVGNYAKSIGEAAGALTGFASVGALAMGVLNKLKEAFFETEGGEKFKKSINEMSKTLFQGIVTKPGRAIASALGIQSATNAIEKEIALTAAIAAKMDEVRKGDRKDLVEITRLEGEITQLRLKAADFSLSITEQADANAAVTAKEAELIAYKKADKQEELDLVNMILKVRKDDTTYLDMQAKLTAEIAEIENSQNVRLYSRDQNSREKVIEAQKKAREEAQKAAAEQAANEIELIKARFDVAKSIDEEGLNTRKDLEKDFQSFQEDQDKLSLEAVSEQVDAELEEWKRKYDEETKLAQEAEKEKAKLKQELATSSFELLDTLVARSNERQMTSLQKQQDRELQAAGNNADEKQKINERYEKKKIEIQRKSAVAEKATALFQIAIDTAKGVVNALSKVVTAPLVPYIIANGAIQAAIVAARPLPAYAKGTAYSAAGPSVVGERGSELMISPSGQVSLSRDSAEIVNLQRGTQIIPSDETNMILAAASAAKSGNSDAVQERRHKELIKAINDKETLIMPSSVGQPITMRKGNLYKTYFNRHLQ